MEVKNILGKFTKTQDEKAAKCEIPLKLTKTTKRFFKNGSFHILFLNRAVF